MMQGSGRLHSYFDFLRVMVSTLQKILNSYFPLENAADIHSQFSLRLPLRMILHEAEGPNPLKPATLNPEPLTRV